MLNPKAPYKLLYSFPLCDAVFFTNSTRLSSSGAAYNLTQVPDIAGYLREQGIMTGLEGFCCIATTPA